MAISQQFTRTGARTALSEARLSDFSASANELVNVANLPLNLAADFQRTNDDAVGKVTKLAALFQEDAAFKAGDYRVDGDISTLGGYVGFSAAIAAITAHLRGEAEAEEKRDAERFRALLASLKSDLEIIRIKIDEVEDRLFEKFGKNFLLKNAKMYLDAETLKRLDGETDKEYKERMQGELEALMLDESGDVKAEYRHLDIAKWLSLKVQERALERGIRIMHDAEKTYLATGDRDALVQAVESVTYKAVNEARHDMRAAETIEVAADTVGASYKGDVKASSVSVSALGMMPPKMPETDVAQEFVKKSYAVEDVEQGDAPNNDAVIKPDNPRI